MAARSRRPADPRLALVEVVDRLGDRLPLVTLADIEQAAARPSSRLPLDGLADLVAAAVEESLLLKDLRTFYDRASGSTSDAWVYRVNARHPVAAQLLDE
ncbi:MAG: hypothetical protein IT306_30120 [Chloroflexi bacterium]|nr:hypothetical protein [Chloroflexota bacterium]